MLIKNDNYYHKLNSFTSSVIKLDGEYFLKEYGPETKELLGPNEVLPFDALGYAQEDKEEIKVFLEELKAGNAHRVIAAIGDRSNRPRLMDIRGQYNEEEELCYTLSLWDLENVERDFDYYKDQTWKYRVMIGMSGLTFFDYDVDKDVVSFYRYVSRKSVRLFFGSFTELEESFLKSVDNKEHDINEAHKIMDQLKRCESTVEGMVHCNLLSRVKKFQKLHIRAQFDAMSGHRRMYGVVSNMSETEEDVPFYMTTAGVDSMTGLLNKRSLVEYTEDILANPATAVRKHYMIILDMDDFKAINDYYGHQIGDKALVVLANTLVDVVKDDGIVGRYGGDEFYILTERVNDEEELRGMLRTIRDTFAARAKKELNIDNAHLSMGVSLHPDNGNNYKDLMHLADKSLYIAKERGKNRYIIYRPAMHENIVVGVEKRGISSYDEQAKVMNKAVYDLFIKGKSAIKEHLPLIVKGFDLDSIDVFYGEDLSLAHSFGKYSSNLDPRVFLGNADYLKNFDENGVYRLNNCYDLVKTIPEIYDYLVQKNCIAVIQVALPSVENPKFFISFNMMNRTHKWSDAEISYLGLFATLANELLSK